MSMMEQGETRMQYDGQGAWIPSEISISNALVGWPEDLRSTLAHEVQHAIQAIEGFAVGEDTSIGEDSYNRLAGEVEPRNVQGRIDYTPQQRRATLLAETEDVAREDQIFLMENSGVSVEEVYKQKISNSEENRLSLQESVNYEESNGANAVEQNNDEQRQTNSTRVADDAARIMERARDRSNIRMLEEGLGSAYRSHSNDSERDRREAESERLVNVAKENGLYIPKKEPESLGEKIQKHTGESVVYINTNTERVYKIKDPYAKSALKSGVQPSELWKLKNPFSLRPKRTLAQSFLMQRYHK